MVYREPYNKLFYNENTVGTICEYERELMIVREIICKLDKAVVPMQPLERETDDYVH